MPEVAPNTLPDVPRGYARFGTTRGFQPKPYESLDWFIKGKGGRGKSNFISSFERCLHLDVGGSAHSVVNAQAVRIPESGGLGYKALAEVFTQLIKDGDSAKGDVTKLPFRSVALDCVDEVVALFIADYLGGNNPTEGKYDSLPEAGDGRRVYGIIYGRLLKVLTSLSACGYGLVLGCHERDHDITVPKVDGGTEVITRTDPAVGASLAGVLEAMCDISGVLAPKTVVERTPRVIQTPSGGKTIYDEKSVSKIVMQVECSARYEAKRRLHLFRGEIVVPLQNGWAALKPFYEEKVKEMRGLLESGKPIPTE